MGPTVLLQVEFEGSDDGVGRRARDALRREEGVLETGFAKAEADSGRAVELLDFSKLLLTVAPEAVKGVFAAVADWLRRTGAPNATGRIRVRLGEDEILVEGRELGHLSVDSLADGAQRVLAALSAARAARS